MSETAISTMPTLIEGMDFPTYLGDPAPEPSLTSSLVSVIFSKPLRARCGSRCSRLNPDYYQPEKKDRISSTWVQRCPCSVSWARVTRYRSGQ